MSLYSPALSSSNSAIGKSIARQVTVGERKEIILVGELLEKDTSSFSKTI